MSYIKKERLNFLNQALQTWFNWTGWAHSLLDPLEVKYIKQKGVHGVNLLIFILFCIPFCYIKKFGFSGVPFPFNLLKRRNKQKVNINQKINKKNKKIKKILNSVATSSNKEALKENLKVENVKKKELLKKKRVDNKKKAGTESFKLHKIKREKKIFETKNVLKIFLYALQTYSYDKGLFLKSTFELSFPDCISPKEGVGLPDFDIKPKDFFMMCINYKVSRRNLVKFYKILVQEFNFDKLSAGSYKYQLRQVINIMRKDGNILLDDQSQGFIDAFNGMYEELYLSSYNDAEY